MNISMSRAETLLAAFLAVLFVVALAGPLVPSPDSRHAFVDQSLLSGIPHAGDVLSNMAFLLAGLLGLLRVGQSRHRSLSNAERAMALLFFSGLVLTAACSGWYHLRPDDAGLAIDRSGMAVAFAGALGLAAATRVGTRAGCVLGLLVLATAPFAIQASTSGNVLPWAVLQFGGVALLAAMACLRVRPFALDIRWGWMLAAYALAKVFEMNDALIHEATMQWVSGHSVKHVVAALAAWPVLSALGALREPGQNARIKSIRTLARR
jgi:hypothetical protein